MGLGCCCGCKVRIPPFDVWENITTVAAYPGNADATPIAPYSRTWNEWQDACILARDEPNATCGRNDGTQPVCWDMNFDGTDGSQNPMTQPEGISECLPGESDLVLEVAANCYRKTDATVNLSHNCSPGWKGVTALAYWPGHYGFLNDLCCTASPKNGQEQTKFTTVEHRTYMRRYRSETRNVDHSHLAGGCGATFGNGAAWIDQDEAEWVRNETVDAAGNATRVGHRTYAGTRVIDDGFLAVDPDLDGCLTPVAGVSESKTCCDVIEPVLSSEDGRGDCGVVVGVGPYYPYRFMTAYGDVTVDPCTGLLTTAASDFIYEYGPCTLAELEAYFLGDFPIADGYSGHVVSLTNDRLEFYVIGSDSYNNGETDVEWEFEFSSVTQFTGSLTFEQVMKDCITLLDEWPLHDDAVYPWRSDKKTWLQPYVYRDAAPTVLDWKYGFDDNCEPVATTVYTGRIIGSPNPPGYGRHFNFNHTNWARHENVGTCNGCEMSLGATSPTEIPATATSWTDYSVGASMTGPGAHIQHRIDPNYSSNSPAAAAFPGVRMTKWAETLERWPSVNFFRPFGDDRWRMDMANASCILDDFTTPGTIITERVWVDEIATGDLVIIYGGTTYENEIWRVAGVAGNEITLGAQLDVPEDFIAGSVDEWANHGQWGTYGTVGLLRWQSLRDSTKWPNLRITGKDAAIEVDPVDTYKLAVPAGTQLITGDKITLVGVGNFYYKRLTDTTGEIYTDAALTTQGDGTGATLLRGYEVAPPDQEWNTDAARNTVIVREFETFLRESDEDPMEPAYTADAVQITLDRKTTKQCVFCVSPNSQDIDFFSSNDSGSLTYTWDETAIEADLCFGKEFHMDVVQAIADPFWQVPYPPTPCEYPDMESLPCSAEADSFKHYPPVEPLMLPPVGAPTLPTDVTLYTEGNVPDSVGSDFCESEPRDRGTPHNYRSAWLTCPDKNKLTNHGL